MISIGFLGVLVEKHVLLDFSYFYSIFKPILTPNIPTLNRCPAEGRPPIFWWFLVHISKTKKNYKKIKNIGGIVSASRVECAMFRKD